jgi:hypothetical protein
MTIPKRQNAAVRSAALWSAVPVSRQESGCYVHRRALLPALLLRRSP